MAAAGGARHQSGPYLLARASGPIEHGSSSLSWRASPLSHRHRRPVSYLPSAGVVGIIMAGLVAAHQSLALHLDYPAP